MQCGDRKIVMNGSANFRSSASVETFTIEEDAELFDFFAEYHNVILAEYATINHDNPNLYKQKPVRDREIVIKRMTDGKQGSQ